MQDISDGISKDLTTICKASLCGAEIDLELIPIPSCNGLKKEHLVNFALHGGEEYGLIFTSDKSYTEIKQQLGEVYKIGKITLSKTIYIKNKSIKKELSDLTYKHF
jgi:thiamine-monophosphate kinase